MENSFVIHVTGDSNQTLLKLMLPGQYASSFSLTSQFIYAQIVLNVSNDYLIPSPSEIIFKVGDSSEIISVQNSDERPFIAGCTYIIELKKKPIFDINDYDNPREIQNIENSQELEVSQKLENGTEKEELNQVNKSEIEINNVMKTSFGPPTEKEQEQDNIKEFSNASYGNEIIPNPLKFPSDLIENGKFTNDNQNAQISEISEITSNQNSGITVDLSLKSTITFMEVNYNDRTNSITSEAEISIKEIEKK